MLEKPIIINTLSDSFLEWLKDHYTAHYPDTEQGVWSAPDRGKLRLRYHVPHKGRVTILGEVIEPGKIAINQINCGKDAKELCVRLITDIRQRFCQAPSPPDFSDFKGTVFSLLSRGNEILAFAKSEFQYIQTLDGTKRALDWIDLRAAYEKWYAECLGIMESMQSDRIDDFKYLYHNDDPDLPSIKKALLLGFSMENYCGFKDRMENQIAILSSLTIQIKQVSIRTNDIQTTLKERFVDPTRLEELRKLNSQRFDLARLIKLCEELDICYANQCFSATAMLTRAIVDHIPPILGCKKFSEVANNYSGTKSFKQSMQHLEKSLRKIADSHLHTQIRKKEALPNRTQVNFSNDIDVLLAEIVRILRK